VGPGEFGVPGDGLQALFDQPWPIALLPLHGLVAGLAVRVEDGLALLGVP